VEVPNLPPQVPHTNSNKRGQTMSRTEWVTNSHPEYQDEISQRMLREWNERINRDIQSTIQSARAKDAELIQQLVNALQNAHDRHNGVGGTMYISEEHKALSAAKAAGFKPSDR
jgi:hypothetical protein